MIFRLLKCRCHALKAFLNTLEELRLNETVGLGKPTVMLGRIAMSRSGVPRVANGT